MFQKVTNSPYLKHGGERVNQGDILRDVSLVEMRYSKKITDNYNVEKKTFPYVVVLSQDCDLSEDFNNRKEISGKHDKFMESILVCPAYPAETFREGKHLEEF